MKHIKQVLIGFMATLAASSISAKELATPISTHTPEGYWRTIDDVTGRPKSIIHIWKAENNALYGQVVKVFPKQGNDQNKLCTACNGENHNKPIVGMVIMSGLKAEPTQWGEGRILDPENGKTYSCSVRVAESGQKLNVHGYIGIPLLGRSQLWERVEAIPHFVAK